MAVSFVLDGKTVEVGGLSKQQKSLLQLIQNLPADKFVSTEGLAKRAGITAEGIGSAVRRLREELKDNSMIVPGVDGAGKTTVFGNKRSIAKLREQLEASNVK